MGQVTGEVVAAAFGCFNPKVVVPAVGMGWQIAGREAILDARERGATEMLRRVLGDEPGGLARVTGLLRRAADVAPWAGRSVYAVRRDHRSRVLPAADCRCVQRRRRPALRLRVDYRHRRPAAREQRMNASADLGDTPIRRAVSSGARRWRGRRFGRQVASRVWAAVRDVLVRTKAPFLFRNQLATIDALN
jgi:hypothetical protein